MLATAIIVFREMLEICLILGIISAALNNLKNKTMLLLLGGLGGVFLSSIFALTIAYISGLFDGNGQEILNILILIISIVCINFTIIWLNKHSKELRGKINNATTKLISKEISVFTFVLVIALVISREGAEIILFLNGVYAAGGLSTVDLIMGFVVGASSGAVVGVLLYNGLLRIHIKHFFNTINVMLILLSAGMASQLANYISSINLIEVLSEEIWDSSWLLSETSFTGKILYSLLGYSSKPTELQVIFYLGSIAITSWLLFRGKNISK